MALQGIFYGTTANVRITPIIEWSAVQSVTGNYSDITATLSYTKKNSNPTTGGKWTGSLTIGDQTKNVSSQYIEVYQDKVTEVMTFTARVYHDSYGKATVTISATGGITNPSSSSLQNTKISAEITLDTIPRASEISCTTANVGEKPTISITRADASFTHTVSYKFGELTGTIAEKTKDTTIKSWTIPESFYAQIPGSKTGSGTLTCVTYSGDTKIGTSTCKLNVTTDEAVCKPSITVAQVEDGNEKTLALTGDKNILVRYQSTALCAFSAQPNCGAEIAEISVNGVKNAASFPSVDTGYFLFRAKDSRGYITEEPVEKTLVPYIPLTARAVATRTDPVSGNARLYVEGRYFSGSFGAEENTLTVKYRLAGAEDYIPVAPQISGNTYTAEVTLTGLDYTCSFTYEVVVEDKLCTEPATVTVGRGIPVFDWGENDFRFHVPVYLQEGALADYVVETGTASMGDNGTWYYQKWASGKAECYGCRNYGDLDVSTAWGALYRCALMSQSLPSGLFASAPDVIHITIGSTDNGGWIAFDGKKVSKASVGQFMVLRGVTAIMAQTHLGFHIIGRWK